MSFKDRVEQSPVLILAGVAIGAFVAGISTVTFLEARESKLRDEIIRELREENEQLEDSRNEMELFIKTVVTEYLSERAIRLDTGEIVEGTPLGGENSEVRKNIIRELEGADSGEISNIIRDPTSDLRRVLGF